MIHYHGGPHNPLSVLYTLAGRHFCVSHWQPDQVEHVHKIGQSVMLDNGAYSAWKQKRPVTDWSRYYAWTDRWLDYPTTWAVIPDEIDAGSQYQDALIADWPHGERGAPVWHMNEPVDRMLRLLDRFPRICVGSTDEFRVVLSAPWRRRMDEMWNAIAIRHRRLPWVHMLRGMQLSGMHYPFASVDSTDVARNHNRPQNTAASMAARWDAMQTPSRWHEPALQEEMPI